VIKVSHALQQLNQISLIKEARCMEFKEQSELLKKVLGLQKEPLAITFTNDEISDGQY
jgi:hypothetical protein